jgi:Leucine-rich repeat (LRR) protein
MKILFSFLFVFLITQNLFAFTDVCSRNHAVVSALEELLAKDCSEITSQDLLSIGHIFPNALTTQLHKSDFEGMTNLKDVGLTERNVTTIDQDLFQNTPHLTSISLDYNSITSLSENTFQGLNELTRISMLGNKFSNLPENIFQNLPSLKYMGLGQPQLTTLPLGIFRNVNLDTIIYEGDLSLIDPTYLQNIEYFSIVVNTTVPNNFFSQFHNIKKISVFYALGFEAGAFAGLPNLQDLEIRHFEGNQLPESLFQNLPQLKHLEVADAPLVTSLPDSIFHGLTNVTFLDINESGVQTINDQHLVGLTALTQFQIHNSIQNISLGAFATNPNLTWVGMGGAISDSNVDALKTRYPQVEFYKYSSK